MLILGKGGHIICGGCGDSVPLGMKSALLDICDISILQFFTIMLQANVISVQNADPSG